MDFADTMHVTFMGDAQQKRYEMLSPREMYPTIFVHDPTLSILVIRESVRFMFNQIGWDYFIHHQQPTYRNLALEFLSSLHYNPDIGLGLAIRLVSFRLFNFTHRFTIREFAA